MNVILKSVTALKMALIQHAYWKPLITRTLHPAETQRRLLLSILKSQQNTTFGRDHKFQNIHSVEDYQAAVPAAKYEEFRPYVERQEEEKRPHLNRRQPKMYAQTSGTTGKPKYIPIQKETIAQFRRSQHIVAYAKYLHIKGVFDGKVLAIVSPAEEGRLPTGTPYGSMSGLIYQSMPSLLRSKYVVPANVYELHDYERKYYLIAKHAIAEKNISMIATANPSTLTKLESVVNSHLDFLLDEIQADNPKRGSELRAILAQKGVLTFADTWPNLKSITTWTGGSCSVLIPKIESMFPKDARIVEMGYLSSEFRGSITVDPIANLQIPTLHENFFEFVERDNWEKGVREFLTLAQIEVGKQYYVFTTTTNGLYRYDIDDIVEVTGRFNATPAIKFVQKGKGATNLTGEKLYESQLIQAVVSIEAKRHVRIPFFMMIGCQDSLQYTLVLEHRPFETEDIEHYINELNTEFKEKRRSGRLQPINIFFVKDGTGEAYKRAALSRGQREGQYKLVHLIYAKDNFFDFKRYIRGHGES